MLNISHERSEPAAQLFRSPRVHTKKRRGFTLIEMLITVAIYGIILVATAELLRVVYISGATQPLELNEVDQAQSVATLFNNEIRDASTGNDGSFPLNQASTTQIIFFSPYDTMSSTTVERIRYYFSGGTLYKGVTLPSGTPSSYNLANEGVRAVLYNVSSTSSIFFYYNGTYSGTSSPLTQPVNVNNVTYVRMNILVQTKELRNSTSTFTISTGAAVRNLKTNLGN